MKTVEEAYKSLANSILDFINQRRWDQAICNCKIYSKMASASHFLIHNGIVDETAEGWPKNEVSPGSAALFLRDDLLRTTGQRIWGLTFTLHPDGKFKIEYDYNRPEGYEETEDIISSDEINASLKDFIKPEGEG